MKRNQETSKKARLKTSARYLTGGGNSRYAQKVKRGDQMYGTGRASDGCCAHLRPANNMQAAVSELRRTHPSPKQLHRWEH